MTLAVRFPFLCALVTAAFGCDPGVKTTGASQSAGDRLSAVHESCAATVDCQGDLRCRNGTCRSPRASVKGDYYAAAGRRFFADGDAEAAVAAFRKGEAEYRGEELEVPPQILCGLGRALATDPTDPMRAEEAASKLHRCVNGLPAGAPLYAEALHALAALHEVGFDPVHLAREDTADRYLTRAPEKPPVDSLVVEVTPDKDRKSRAFREFVEAIESEEVKGQLVPCWKAYWEEAREPELAVKIPFKHHNRYDEYRDIEYATLDVVKYEPPSGEGMKAATKCVEEVVAPVGKKLARKVGSWSRWTSTFTIKLKSE